MKSKRFSVGQIVSALKQHEAGLPIVEIARKLGIAEGHFIRGICLPLCGALI